jgi:hypothetical protein
MSGIEAVGLVFGLWPVVINLVEMVKASKNGFAEQALAMSITVNERIFRQSILKLLQRDENLSEKDRMGLISGEKEFLAIWRDPEFVARLERRLDNEMFTILQHEAEGILKILASLRKKIETKDSESVSQASTSSRRRSREGTLT